MASKLVLPYLIADKLMWPRNMKRFITRKYNNYFPIHTYFLAGSCGCRDSHVYNRYLHGDLLYAADSEHVDRWEKHWLRLAVCWLKHTLAGKKNIDWDLLYADSRAHWQVRKKLTVRLTNVVWYFKFHARRRLGNHLPCNRKNIFINRCVLIIITINMKGGGKELTSKYR